MNQYEIREKFEAWADSTDFGFTRKLHDGNYLGDYEDPFTATAWEAWQEGFKLGHTAAMHQIAQSAKP